MKKLFKRIAVLICVIALFNLPMSALAATTTPTPVPVFYEPNAKFFEYQPGPYYYPQNTGGQLSDTLHPSGDWDVPAGNTLHFYCNIRDAGSVSRIIVFNKNYDIVYNEIYVSTVNFPSHEVLIPPASTDESYRILVSAISDIIVTGYVGVNY